jgi:FSR family fosmidomycin resistance protein-like MFS transporter
MKTIEQSAGSVTAAISAQQTVFPILLALSFTHLLNDTMQSLIPSIYPMVKDSFHLNFSQIGLITFTFQISASVLQPVVGWYTDKRPQPYALAVGMCFTLLGLVSMSFATSFHLVLVSVALIGVGSAIFHPEASRIARMASGGRHGMAQSLFQVGGNAGSSLGPLLAALILLPYGRFQVIWFSLVALLAIIILSRVGRWYKDNMHLNFKKPASGEGDTAVLKLSKGKVILALGILLLLIFSKYIYMASLTDLFVCLPFCRSGRNIYRRAGWGSHRQKIRNLDFNSWCCTLCAGTALCESLLDLHA